MKTMTLRKFNEKKQPPGVYIVTAHKRPIQRITVEDISGVTITDIDVVKKVVTVQPTLDVVGPPPDGPGKVTVPTMQIRQGAPDFHGDRPGDGHDVTNYCEPEPVSGHMPPTPPDDFAKWNPGRRRQWYLEHWFDIVKNSHMTPEEMDEALVERLTAYGLKMGRP